MEAETSEMVWPWPWWVVLVAEWVLETGRREMGELTRWWWEEVFWVICGWVPGVRVVSGALISIGPGEGTVWGGWLVGLVDIFV